MKKKRVPKKWVCVLANYSIIILFFIVVIGLTLYAGYNIA